MVYPIINYGLFFPHESLWFSLFQYGCYQSIPLFLIFFLNILDKDYYTLLNIKFTGHLMNLMTNYSLSNNWYSTRQCSSLCLYYSHPANYLIQFFFLFGELFSISILETNFYTPIDTLLLLLNILESYTLLWCSLPLTLFSG